MDNKNSQEYFKENRQLLTMEKIFEMDGIFIENNDEIMLKISEIEIALGAIGKILGERGSVIKELRETCLSVMERLKKEEEEKKELEKRIRSQEQKYNNLKEAKKILDDKWREECKKQRENFEQSREDYKKYYEKEKDQKEKAESDLRSQEAELNEEKQRVSNLRAQIESEQAENQRKTGEVATLKNDLDVKNNQISELEEKVKQFQSKEEKMPALMRLYDAYNEVMEKKEGLPKAFTDHWQRVVPMDDFDSFLEKVFKRLFPINYYQSIQAFIARCDQSGEISDEDKKKALRVSDGLLSEIFVFGSKYLGEEKLFWMDDIKAGDKFDSGLCIYIDRKGTMFGNIAEVLLHGIRDEKNNKIYHSYVEGE